MSSYNMATGRQPSIDQGEGACGSAGKESGRRPRGGVALAAALAAAVAAAALAGTSLSGVVTAAPALVEPPQLAELVKGGKLPPVEQRAPEQPEVVAPLSKPAPTAAPSAKRCAATPTTTRSCAPSAPRG
jgi:hypothetical protein